MQNGSKAPILNGMSEISSSLEQLKRSEGLNDQLTIVHNSLEIARIGKQALRTFLAEASDKLQHLKDRTITAPTHEYFYSRDNGQTYSRRKQSDYNEPFVVTGIHDRFVLFDERQLTDMPSGFKPDPVRICLRLDSLEGEYGHYEYVPIDQIDGDITVSS